jgi:hypothetical protein
MEKLTTFAEIYSPAYMNVLYQHFSFSYAIHTSSQKAVH